MNTNEYLQQIEEKIYQEAIDAITSWNEPDIYVVSFYFWEDEQDPCNPRLSIGFNTERRYQETLTEVDDGDEHDARWNFAWWLQNDHEVQYGCDPQSAELIEKWVMSCGADRIAHDDWDKWHALEDTFINMLVRVVQRIHKDGILKSRFGKELPIIIHELEYYDEPLKINLAANGPELIEQGFIDLCKGR